MYRAQAIISECRTYSWKDLRRGVTANFVMTLLSLAMLTYIIWGFDYIDGLYDSVVMNLLPAVLPPMVFYEAMQKREARRFDWSYAGFVFFIGLALLLAISDSYDVDELGINVFVIMASSPWLLIFGITGARREDIGNWHGAGGLHIDGVLGRARILGWIEVAIFLDPIACCLNLACLMDSLGMDTIQGR